ncbi:(3,5-dihydroxyphenyl)acetyl-CoA 1,2-dioxygenase DpgC [Streptomyces albireticuli]|uniref:(3,5-dihydroxyphenyl)acetyl-CoA 1,2-dioxygenase DpgC n=1 Tax=Streptomyces albireticuli TaxID=1940 RepID=UPI00369AAF48
MTTTPPTLTGALAEDTALLSEHTTATAARLAGLPAPPLRDPAQRALAEELHTASRSLRQRFLHRHADAVYDALTDGRTVHLRLDGLARDAADRFPGLVPTEERLAAERALPQAAKEGLEIDQGIFFRALLRSPYAGPHLADAMALPCPRALELRERYRTEGSVRLASVRLERHGTTAHLTVDNAHCLNAEDERLIDDMETAVDLVLLDEASHVGVVRGGTMTHPRYAGRRVFSAGINLKELHAGRISLTGFLLRRELGYLTKIAHGLLVDPAPDAYPYRTRHKPWIAAVDSFAIGGGMQLLMVFDHVIAADDAHFSLPAANEGIVPGAGNFRLGRMTGARPARRVILGGRRIHATDPDALLVCDEVVPGEEITARVDAAAAHLDNPAVTANRRMLALAEEPQDRFLAYLAEFAYVQATRLYATDVLEKVARTPGRPRGE